MEKALEKVIVKNRFDLVLPRYMRIPQECSGNYVLEGSSAFVGEEDWTGSIDSSFRGAAILAFFYLYAPSFY